LFVVRATGAGFREIVHSRSGTGSPSDSVAPYDPRWSPGGASVAFSNGFAEIWRVNPATRALRRITRSSIERDRQPAWSPDGKRLVYAQHCSLVTRPVSDGKTRLLARWPGSTSCFGAPDWSPDGQRVVFDRNGQQLFMINADGLGLRPLTPRGDFARFPRWSPDGKQIAFITGASLSVMKADGSQRRTIVQRDGLNFNVNPAWSPNGHRIAFVVTNTFDVQQDLKGNEIYTVRLDGRDARPIHIPELPPNVWSDIDGLDWR
jgi:TolB protein